MAGGAHRARRDPRPPTTTLVLDPTEVAPVARVPRSRLAFALSVTLAALPILVLDNLPGSVARAETGEDAGAVLTAPTAPTTESTLAPASASPSTAPTTTTPEPTSTTVATETRVVARQSAPAAQAPAPTTTTTTAAPRPGDPNDPATWDRLAQCESGGDWAINTGNGYYGGLQFSLATWQRFGGTGYPHQASKATQISIGKQLQAADGWGAWPGCARHLGYI